MTNAARVLRFVQRNYLALMAVFSAIFLALNYGDQSGQGIVPYYAEFARVIWAGFNPRPGHPTLPTFPMWGYGWMILVLQSKLAILIFQQILALIAAAVSVFVVKRDARLPRDSVGILKALLVLSLPWYALHSVLWPYSIAASLLVISISLLASETPGGNSLAFLLVSALCFGLLLNFRSDYILFPPACALAFFFLVRPGWSAARSAILWTIVVYLALLPWGLYTKRASGHMLLSSTNSGQVVFLGLGVLPQNRWGITADDGDPILRQIAAKMGPDTSALNYAGNKILLDETASRIAAEPREYARKVAYSALITATRGFHPGSFFDRSSCEPRCYETYVRQRSDLLQGKAPRDTELLNPARTVLMLIASAFSRVLLLACMCALPFAAVLAYRRRSLLLALSVLTALYQGAISVFLYTLPAYTSNAYYFHLLNLVAVIAWLRERRSGEIIMARRI